MRWGDRVSHARRRARRRLVDDTATCPSRGGRRLRLDSAALAAADLRQLGPFILDHLLDRWAVQPGFAGPATAADQIPHDVRRWQMRLRQLRQLCRWVFAKPLDLTEFSHDQLRVDF